MEQKAKLLEMQYSYMIYLNKSAQVSLLLNPDFTKYKTNNVSP